MKFTEPWGHQRLSFLLEKAASREAKMWKVYVPKKPSSQVNIYLLRAEQNTLLTHFNPSVLGVSLNRQVPILIVQNMCSSVFGVIGIWAPTTLTPALFCASAHPV